MVGRLAGLSACDYESEEAIGSTVREKSAVAPRWPRCYSFAWFG